MALGLGRGHAGGASSSSACFGITGPCALHSQPKGADRKQKTDREKMEKRTAQEKEKYQPSYETTILTEVSPRPGADSPRAPCQAHSGGSVLEDFHLGESFTGARSVVACALWDSCSSDKTQRLGVHSRNHWELSAALECVCTFQNEDIFVILNMYFITQFRIQSSVRPKKALPWLPRPASFSVQGRWRFWFQVY